MSLLKHLLFWPYTGPRYLVDFSLRQVEGVVREELTDDSAVKAELLELQLQLELGDISDDEYVAEEARLMARLRDIRSWREQFGMGVSGGLVRVQQDAGDEAAEEGVDAATKQEPGGPQVADPKGGVEIDFNLDWE